MNRIKKVLSIGAVIILCSSFIFAQASAVFSENSESQSLQSELSKSQSQIEESNFTFDQTTEEQTGQTVSSGSSFWAFFRMIIVLAIVIGIIYFVFRILRKNVSPEGDDDPFLRKVSAISVGPGKSVQVVTLLDKAFLIGVSENSVNLIKEIEDKELINAMNLHSDKTTNHFKAKSFADVLEMFMPTKNQNSAGIKETEKTQENSVFDSSTRNLINSIKNKRIENKQNNENNDDNGNNENNKMDGSENEK